MAGPAPVTPCPRAFPAPPCRRGDSAREREATVMRTGTITRTRTVRGVTVALAAGALLLTAPSPVGAAGRTPSDPAPGGPQRPYEPDVPGPRTIDSLSVAVTPDGGTKRGVCVGFDRTSRSDEGGAPAGARRFVFLFDESLDFRPEAFPVCARLERTAGTDLGTRHPRVPPARLRVGAGRDRAGVPRTSAGPCGHVAVRVGVGRDTTGRRPWRQLRRAVGRPTEEAALRPVELFRQRPDRPPPHDDGPHGREPQGHGVRRRGRWPGGSSGCPVRP